MSALYSNFAQAFSLGNINGSSPGGSYSYLTGVAFPYAGGNLAQRGAAYYSAGVTNSPATRTTGVPKLAAIGQVGGRFVIVPRSPMSVSAKNQWKALASAAPY